MKKMKKLLAVLMLVCMLVSILPMGTVAFASGTGLNTVYFQLNPANLDLHVKTSSGDDRGLAHMDDGTGRYYSELADGAYSYSASFVGYRPVTDVPFNMPYTANNSTIAITLVVCDHTVPSTGASAFVNGICSVCQYVCTHHYPDTYTDGKCTDCGMACTHSYPAENSDGKCIHCHYAHTPHAYDMAGGVNADADGKCNVCNMPCTHNYPDTYTDGKCTICGFACTHSFGGDTVCDICGFTCADHTYNIADETNTATYRTGNCKVCGTAHTPHVYDQTGGVNADADGLCNTCYMACIHSFPTTYTDGKCVTCGYQCTDHTWVGGVCSKCHKVCTHAYPSTYTDGKCTICGEVCTNHVDTNPQDCVCDNCHGPAHNYINGICTKNTEHRQTVAKIGTTEYTSLASAFGAAVSGNTIEVVASIIETPLTAPISVNCNVTLNMQTSYTLAGTNGYISVESGGTLTISGPGTLTSTLSGSSNGAVTVNGGALISGANITGKPAIKVNSGMLTVNSGTVSGGTQPAVLIDQTADISSIRLNGGTFTGSYSVKHIDNGFNNGGIALVGGTYTGEVYSENNAIQAAQSVTLPVVAPDANGLVKAGDIVSVGNNRIVTSGDKVTIPAAGIAAAADRGTISITTGKGSATFNNAALISFVGANADISFEIKDISTAAETAAGTKHFTLKLNDGAITTFGGQSVPIKLNVGTAAPAELVHTKGDGTVEYFYPAGATVIAAHGEFTYESPYANFSVTSFSDITANLRPTGLPEIVTTSISNAVVNEAYSFTLAAHGTNSAADPMTWTVSSGALPSWLALSPAGVLTGTPTAAAAAVTFTVKATNSFGSDEQQLSIIVDASRNYEVYDQTTGASKYYPTFEEAYRNTNTGNSLIAHVDTPHDITIGKNIIFDGNGKSTGAISVTGNVEPTIRNVTSTMLNAASPAKPTLTGTNVITTVVSQPGATVTITGGTYEHLYGSTAGAGASAGSFVISGGSFGAFVPMEYCLRDVRAADTVIQYESYQSGSRWLIRQFVPDITAIDHSAYFVYRSTNTLSFTTNLPYSMTDSGTVTDPPTTTSGDLYRVTITKGNTTSTIRPSYYTLSQNDNGNTVVTLSNTYLRSLTNDTKYTLNIVTKEGIASDVFHVSTTGKTGDSSNIGMWMWIMGGSVLVLCGAAGYIVYRSKKKKK